MMSTRANFSRLPFPSPGPVTGSTIPPVSVDRDVARTPCLQEILDDHFANIFKESVLSQCQFDDLVTQAFHIIAFTTRSKIRGLALAVHTHWTRLQILRKDGMVFAAEIVTLISKITDHLARLSILAKIDFLDDLGELCIEKLKLTFRSYAILVHREAQPISRKNLFMRVMAVVAMIGILFRGGLLRYPAILDGLEYIATLLPWPDAVAIIYALLHELGPKFTLDAGWHFVQRLLAHLLPLANGLVRDDPLRQLVSTIATLVEWHHRTQFTLYHTYPGRNSHSRT